MSSLTSLGSKHLVPIAILLTSSGSSGDRLLFQYPFEDGPTQTQKSSSSSDTTPATANNTTGSCGNPGGDHDGDSNFKSSANVSGGTAIMTGGSGYGGSAAGMVSVGLAKSPSNRVEEMVVNPYSLSLVEDLTVEPSPRLSFFHHGSLSERDRTSLANLLVVQRNMCGRKLDIKLDDMVFVGYPCLDGDTWSTFSVVFVMHAIAPKDVIHNYYLLARQIACAIRHEEKRCRYFSEQRSSIHSMLDEHPTECPFRHFLVKSQLCRELKRINDSITESGKVYVKINNWIPVSHCLPHRAYTICDGVQVEPASVLSAVKGIRPYHSLLLLHPHPAGIQEHLCEDACPTLIRLVKVADPPLRTLHSIATNIDVTYSHLLQLARSLVLWGYALLIYPLCETNCYVLAPGIELTFTEELMLDFADKFPDLCLPELLAGFSTPIMLRDHQHLELQEKVQTHLLIWLLRRRLLVQLHTYVTLALDDYLPMIDNSGSPLQQAQQQPPKLDQFEDSVVEKLTHALGDMAKLKTVLQLPGARDRDLLALFTTLLPYMDGQWHIEHMMFRESKTRTEIVRCIDLFSPILITTLLPDPVTSCFAGIT